MIDVLLDNPVWSALTTAQARHALGDASARRFPRDIGPFIAVPPEVATLPTHVRELVAVDEQVNFVGHVPQLDASWRTEHAEPILQMVQQASGRGVRPPGDIVALDDAHAEAMLSLTGLVYPGYFRPRTHVLGRYFGVLDGGRLAAMAGERMAVTGCTEISAVCTHPDFLGRGLAHRLVEFVAAAIHQRGQLPFLHVSSRNARAIRVYEATGFVVRKELGLRCVVRVADGS